MTATAELRPPASNSLVDGLDAAGILAAARARKAAEDRAAADVLELAAAWADLHPPESIHHAAAFAGTTVGGCEAEEPIAGEGCPLVAEFCVAELGAVLGISTVAAKRLVGHALELRHRLPRLWAHVRSGRVPAWRARSVAEATIHATPALTPEAAGWVDVQAAAVAGKVGPAQLDRLVAEAIRIHHLTLDDPTADPEDGWQHVDPRHATLRDEGVHFSGTMHFEADLDIADGLDLDRALAHGAELLQALGSDESLDARRAAALGDLARTQTALDLHVRGHGSPSDQDGLPAARGVVLHVHLGTTSGEGSTPVLGPTARLEEGQRLVLLDQVTSWCGASRTKVTVKPVIDLEANLTAPGYAVPARIREQVALRDVTCVFPWCGRPARSCDVDHVVEHDQDAEAADREQPGPTESWNLAALCRRHHRLKTKTAWRYRMVAPGVFEWTSPHGHRFRRDPVGSTAIGPPVPVEPDDPLERP